MCSRKAFKAKVCVQGLLPKRRWVGQDTGVENQTQAIKWHRMVQFWFRLQAVGLPELEAKIVVLRQRLLTCISACSHASTLAHIHQRLLTCIRASTHMCAHAYSTLSACSATQVGQLHHLVSIYVYYSLTSIILIIFLLFSLG